jgi:hypothetical protein
MAATLEAAGGGASGQQVRGVAAQYQLDGVNGVSELSSTSINPGGGPTGVTSYDSGNILGNIKPGGAGEKLTNGTIQRSSQLICNGTPGVVGNALTGIAGGASAIPLNAVGTGISDGLSLGASRE